jgi:hypothetical protein
LDRIAGEVHTTKLWRWPGFLVGAAAIFIGVAGLILHLDSHCFRVQTLDSLVYTAPFAAPLAYTGLELLLLMNRMVAADNLDWPRWVIFLALGGFVGNFIFSLADHAQNGFFHWTEWIAVAASAFAVGFLLIPIVIFVNRAYVALCIWVMVVQAGVGMLGFYFHLMANLYGPTAGPIRQLHLRRPSPRAAVIPQSRPARVYRFVDPARAPDLNQNRTLAVQFRTTGGGAHCQSSRRQPRPLTVDQPNACLVNQRENSPLVAHEMLFPTWQSGKTACLCKRGG